MSWRRASRNFKHACATVPAGEHPRRRPAGSPRLAAVAAITAGIERRVPEIRTVVLLEFSRSSKAHKGSVRILTP